MAGGALNTARQLGNALGIALLGAVFQSGLLRSLKHGHAVPDAHRTAGALTGGRAGEVIGSTPGARRAVVEHAVRAAFAAGLRDTFYLSAGLGVLGAVLVVALLRTPAGGSSQGRGAGAADRPGATAATGAADAAPAPAPAPAGS
jgi:hypothetical protein